MAARDLLWDESRVKVYSADLSLGDLRLDVGVYKDIVKSVDIVIHVSQAFPTRNQDTNGQAAWPVHFASSLISFEDNIKGELPTKHFERKLISLRYPQSHQSHRQNSFRQALLLLFPRFSPE